ncbi:Fluoroacetyl-CoA thioesterase [compost metagenome]
MAPTPIGRRVRAAVELTAIERRKLTFHINIHDDTEQVGEVTHERFIIDVDKYIERLKQKWGANSP